MSSVDEFDQIGTNLLISHAALALTLIKITRSLQEGEHRERHIQRAAAAYQHICESIPLVRMEKHDLTRLGALLEELRGALDDLAGGSACSADRPSVPAA
jgi:hypothetical protein